MPDPPDGGEPCRLGAVSAQCLRPGDARASEQPALTSLHITWVRRHNQLASTLAQLNPHWSDEKLYQETRRLVAAAVQHITYREFLPIILGHEVLRLFNLELLHKGFYSEYDQRVNPAPANSFSAAAYRFGHSLVQNSFVRSDRFHRPIFNNVSLHDEQSNTENIWSPGSVDRLMLGLVNQPSQKRDEFISVELTNHLFQAPGTGSNGFGLDLGAINIQRGRDHGLPSYTAWRQPCGLSPIRNWTDLQRVMSVETAERFRSLYLNVDDIDLYSAGLAERPVRGGLVGPTFACIIAQQFSNLRRGDRFWYENENFESSFTSLQLQQIRKITFAQIVCETMPEVETIQPFVFLTPDNFENRRELCKSLINFDLAPWTENPTNEEESNKFPRPIEPIFENGVENKAESNSSSSTNKEKNPKFDTEDDIFSFSMPSLKLNTNQKHTTDDVLKQTIFRRDKRQTIDTMSNESKGSTDSFTPTEKYDYVEQSNKFPRANEPIFENGVENKAESNSSSSTNKEKNPKFNTEDDIFSFSKPSLKLDTHQKHTTDDVLKQTIFRRDKRQTIDTISNESESSADSFTPTEKYDNVEHSNKFPRANEPIFENGVENKAESNSSSSTNKEKNPKFNTEDDIFSFSMPSLKLDTNQKYTTDDVLKQTIFRRDKRQTIDTMSNESKGSTDSFTPTEKYDNVEQSNKFPRLIEPIFENGVENKAESNGSSTTKKEKNLTLNTENDIFSFSMLSLKLDTNQKHTTDDVLKQTIFRRGKRQTTDTMSNERKGSSDSFRPTEKYDNVEHRELDDSNFLTLNLDETDDTIETTTISTNITDRNERKRKQPDRRKPKPKPSTQNPVDLTTVHAGIKMKVKNKTKSDLKQMYYGSDYPGIYYPPHYPPTSNEEILIGTKRPSDNLMTYLFNTVRKTSTATTTTPKPDYQFHIQINYFYNSTTETYPRSTHPSKTKRPTYNYDKPTEHFDYNKQTQNYNYNRPYNYNKNKPNSYSVHEAEYTNPSYSSPGQNFHNTFTSDKIDFGQGSNRFTTRKPSVPSNPITVIEINPQNLPKPENTNRPNIYIVNDNFDTQPLRPTYDYNPYRPQTHTYETKPDTVVYKRPITGQITKLDGKPIFFYEQPNNYDHKQYGTEVVYDNEYLADNRRPTLYQRPDSTYSNLHDKLDFNDKQYVKLSSTKKHLFTTPKPINDDKRYVRISTVKGYTTKTDSLSPIYISVQNKESDDDLEMTYDDILEVYMKPDEKSTSPNNNSNDLKTLRPNEKSVTDTKPIIDDTCSTELPRPMNLFIEDDLLEL